MRWRRKGEALTLILSGLSAPARPGHRSNGRVTAATVEKTDRRHTRVHKYAVAFFGTKRNKALQKLDELLEIRQQQSLNTIKTIEGALGSELLSWHLP